MASELLELVQRPAWMADALCREYPAANWFPERGEDVQRLKAICGECLVRQECETYAMSLGPQLEGVWGGLSGLQRRRLRQAKAA